MSGAVTDLDRLIANLDVEQVPVLISLLSQDIFMAKAFARREIALSVAKLVGPTNPQRQLCLQASWLSRLLTITRVKVKDSDLSVREAATSALIACAAALAETDHASGSRADSTHPVLRTVFELLSEHDKNIQTVACYALAASILKTNGLDPTLVKTLIRALHSPTFLAKGPLATVFGNLISAGHVEPVFGGRGSVPVSPRVRSRQGSPTHGRPNAGNQGQNACGGPSVGGLVAVAGPLMASVLPHVLGHLPAEIEEGSVPVSVRDQTVREGILCVLLESSDWAARRAATEACSAFLIALGPAIDTAHTNTAPEMPSSKIANAANRCRFDRVKEVRAAGAELAHLCEVLSSYTKEGKAGSWPEYVATRSIPDSRGTPAGERRAMTGREGLSVLKQGARARRVEGNGGIEIRAPGLTSIENEVRSSMSDGHVMDGIEAPAELRPMKYEDMEQAELKPEIPVEKSLVLVETESAEESASVHRRVEVSPEPVGQDAAPTPSSSKRSLVNLEPERKTEDIWISRFEEMTQRQERMLHVIESFTTSTTAAIEALARRVSAIERAVAEGRRLPASHIPVAGVSSPATRTGIQDDRDECAELIDDAQLNIVLDAIMSGRDSPAEEAILLAFMQRTKRILSSFEPVVGVKILRVVLRMLVVSRDAAWADVARLWLTQLRDATSYAVPLDLRFHIITALSHAGPGFRGLLADLSTTWSIPASFGDSVASSVALSVALGGKPPLTVAASLDAMSLQAHARTTHRTEPTLIQTETSKANVSQSIHVTNLAPPTERTFSRASIPSLQPQNSGSSMVSEVRSATNAPESNRVSLLDIRKPASVQGDDAEFTSDPPLLTTVSPVKASRISLASHSSRDDHDLAKLTRSVSKPGSEASSRISSKEPGSRIDSEWSAGMMGQLEQMQREMKATQN